MNQRNFLTTERLFLYPLNPAELRLWIDNIPGLEKELDCRYRAEPMEGPFLEIVRGQAEIVDGDPENYLFHSFWLLIRREDRVVVGSADFKAPPDKNGAVEIGYGLGKAFEGHGYMTEAVRAMTGWAFRQPGVSSVIAETEKESLASQRILTRCGFQKEREDDTLWWRLLPSIERRTE